MSHTTLVKAASLALAATAGMVWGLKPRSMRGQEASPSPRQYFEGLQRVAGSPGPEDAGRLSEQLRIGSREEVSNALPAILAAARYKDTRVSGLGAWALWGISLRPDGSDLLSGYLAPLNGLISSQDARAVSFVVQALANAWPNPPPEVLPRLLEYLKRQGADTRTQNVILRYLVRGAEENPEAVAAIMEYWSRPLSKDARIGAIEALGNADAKDPRIIDLVISSLDDPDFNVRLTAFQALRSLSPAAVQQARLPMQKAAREYVALVEQKDADPNVQVSAIEQLLLYEPNDPEVVSAVVGFYSRSLDFGLRTSVQNALRHIKNVRLVDLVTSISFR